MPRSARHHAEVLTARCGQKHEHDLAAVATSSAVDKGPGIPGALRSTSTNRETKPRRKGAG